MTHSICFIQVVVRRAALFTLAVVLSAFSALAQHSGVKTNALYLATTTPNVGAEFALSDKWTLGADAGYNPFSFGSRQDDEGRTYHPKFRHWLVMPEIKYWFCKSFQRSYLGLHGIYSEYNVGGLPFGEELQDYRYQGNMYGGGISWGYQWAIGGRWGLEVSLGAGYLHLRYDKYECAECGDYVGKYARDYVGLTKAAITFIYYFN